MVAVSSSQMSEETFTTRCKSLIKTVIIIIGTFGLFTNPQDLQMFSVKMINEY
jgi:hypothetical protein